MSPPDRPHLRKFGLVMAVATAGLGGLLAWRDRPGTEFLLAASAAFFLTALLAPALLAPVERVWMALAHVLGRVVTTVLLVVTFYLVITPVGLLARLFGGDTLGKRRDPLMPTYWVEVERDGPPARPDKPY